MSETCPSCGREYPNRAGLSQHKTWSRIRGYCTPARGSKRVSYTVAEEKFIEKCTAENILLQGGSDPRGLTRGQYRLLVDRGWALEGRGRKGRGFSAEGLEVLHGLGL